MASPTQWTWVWVDSRSLLKFMPTESVMPSNHLILCHPFSSCLQYFAASGSFLMSQLFASGGRSIGVSASASVLPMNSQDRFPLGLTGLIFGNFLIGALKFLAGHLVLSKTFIKHLVCTKKCLLTLRVHRSRL